MLRKSVFMSFIFILLLVGCTQPSSSTLTITLNPGVDTVEVNSEFIDRGVIALLNNKSHGFIVVENTVDITKVGSYYVLYQTTYDSQIKQVKRIVDVVDETPPVITLNPGIDTILLNQLWHDAGVSVSDNSGLFVSIDIFGDVTISMIGEYQITYVATDQYGNQSIATRYVHVIEN